MTADISPEAVERLAQLTDGVWQRLRDGERFSMRVPAEPDRDMDLILSRAANTLRALSARVAELERERGATKSVAATITLDLGACARERDAARAEAARLLEAIGILHTRMGNAHYNLSQMPDSAATASQAKRVVEGALDFAATAIAQKGGGEVSAIKGDDASLSVASDLCGIPADTLRGLRDGSLVAVSKERLAALATPKAASVILNPWQEIARLNSDAEAMLAATQEPPRNGK